MNESVVFVCLLFHIKLRLNGTQEVKTKWNVRHLVRVVIHLSAVLQNMKTFGTFQVLFSFINVPHDEGTLTSSDKHREPSHHC